MKTKYYIPSANIKRGYTLGESHLLKSKVWKLMVMFGEDWTTNGWTLRGFTIWNINGQKYFDKVTSFLDKHDIAYKVNQSTWQTRINISTRKKNLDIIDKLYEKYVEDTMKEMRKSGDFWKKDNFYYNTEAMEHFIQMCGDAYPDTREQFTKFV